MGLRVPVVFSSVAIQDLEFTEKQLGLGVRVTYLPGATAGSERVHRTQDREIKVHIEDGVSTAAQVKAAIERSEANDLVTITVLGDEENPQIVGSVAVAASGTITLDTPELDDEVTVDGSTFAKDTVAERKPFNKIYFNVPVENDEINVGGFTAIYKASRLRCMSLRLLPNLLPVSKPRRMAGSPRRRFATELLQSSQPEWELTQVPKDSLN